MIGWVRIKDTAYARDRGVVGAVGEIDEIDLDGNLVWIETDGGSFFFWLDEIEPLWALEQLARQA